MTHVHDPVSGKLIGYAFGTSAPDPSSPLNSGKKIMWITQIVVHKDFRSDRIATHLIAAATEGFPTLSVLDIVSPHPWAIRAVMRVAGVDMHNIDLDFIAQHGSACLRAVGVPYVNETMFFGSVFGLPDMDPSPNAPNLVSLVHTRFHTEPEWCMRILQEEKKERGWRLGDLPEGHEFFLVLRKK